MNENVKAYLKPRCLKIISLLIPNPTARIFGGGLVFFLLSGQWEGNMQVSLLQKRWYKPFSNKHLPAIELFSLGCQTIRKDVPGSCNSCSILTACVAL